MPVCFSATTTQHLTDGKSGLLRFKVEKSWLYIPDEMVRGAGAVVFDSMVASDLPARLEHELGSIVGGA